MSITGLCYNYLYQNDDIDSITQEPLKLIWLLSMAYTHTYGVEIAGFVISRVIG